MEHDEIGPALRRLRDGQGWMQQDLAARLGLSPAYLSQIERGERPVSPKSADAFRRVVLPLARGEGEDAAEARAVVAALDGLVTRRSAPVIAQDVDVVPVGLLPPGITRQVSLEALGDADAQLWIDPTAQAELVVVDSGRPRVRRAADGQLSVDVSRLLPGSVGARVHDRHFIAVEPAWALEGDQPPYDEYIATRIEVTLGSVTYVVQVEDGATGFPPDAAVVHVLTAENPWPRMLDDDTNADRTRQLRQQMAEAYGEEGAAWGRATTSASGVEVGEDGVALVDQPRTQVLEVAADHGQSAVFEWTREELRVVLLDGMVVARPVQVRQTTEPA